MILVSLHTKSSSTFHAVCLQIEPAKMENPDNEDIILQIEETFHLFLWPNNITTFPPFQSCFIYHVLLFVDDVVASWPQTKISDWSGIKMYRDPCCTEYWNMFYPKVCIMQLLKVVWHRARVITLFTLYFLVYDTSIMILALPCNRGLSDLRQVGGFLRVLRFPPPIKLTATI